MVRFKASKGSMPFDWSWDDTYTIVKGAGLAALGGAVGYLGTVSLDMSSFQGILTAGFISVVANIARKYVTNTTSA